MRAFIPVLSSLSLTALVSCGGVVRGQVAGGQGGNVEPGVEVLFRDSLQLLRGKRVGLITNQSGRDRRGVSTIDLLFHAPGVRLVALFGPEHGIRGAAEAGESVDSSVDSSTGVPVYSL